MGSCEKCIDLKHYACAGKRGGVCECNICGSTLLRDQKIAKRSPRRKRDRRGERQRYYVSPLTSEQARLKSELGVLTHLSTDQVKAIFEGMKEGAYINELAKRLGCSRDMVRTVYRCAAAPPLGERPVPEPVPPCPHCGRPY